MKRGKEYCEERSHDTSLKSIRFKVVLPKNTKRTLSKRDQRDRGETRDVWYYFLLSRRKEWLAVSHAERTWSLGYKVNAYNVPCSRRCYEHTDETNKSVLK